MCHLSHVMCQVSHFTFHLSHVICLVSLLLFLWFSTGFTSFHWFSQFHKFFTVFNPDTILTTFQPFSHHFTHFIPLSLCHHRAPVPLCRSLLLSHRFRTDVLRRPPRHSNSATDPPLAAPRLPLAAASPMQQHRVTLAEVTMLLVWPSVLASVLSEKEPGRSRFPCSVIRRSMHCRGCVRRRVLR